MTEGFPPDQVPPDQVPPDQVPPDQVPPDQVPPDQVPADQFPADQVPPDQVPPDQVPPGPVSPLQYPCTGCGARVEYAPGTTTLVCPYCGYTQQIAAVDTQVQEHDFAAWATLPDKPRLQLGTHVLQCRQCGAQTQTDDLSGSCSFCGAPVVVEVSADPQIAPEGVVPFQIDQRAAQDAVRTWVGSRWFAPNRLKKVSASETMKGTYLPFWTYDAQTESDYRGQRGEHYYVTETYTDDEGRTQTRQVQRTAWYPAAGHVARMFDDVVVPASGHLPTNRLAAMGPWATDQAKAYQPDYLSGFRTLRYDVEPDQGLEAAKQEMARVIEGDCRDDIGGDEQIVNSVNTAYSELMFKLLLMPVWIAAYLYGGKTFQVLVNAHNGQVVGERPYSWIKIFFASLAALIVIAVIAVLVARSRQR
jgi:Zn finger protein HypA/HybF involved in hydrogenase expression